MRQTKRRLEVLTFYNHTGLEKHFEKMAQKGWLIDRISNLGWVYRKIEPKKIHFCISYYPKASEFDPEPSEGQKTFQEFCAHTGWVLACTTAQMQIFYNERENPIPIETDPVLEVETIHAAIKKSFIPAQITLMVMGALFGWINVLSLIGNPILTLSDPMKIFSACCWTMVFMLASLDLWVYFRWHRKAEEAAENGIFLETPDTSAFHWAALAVLAVLVGYLVINIAGSSDTLLQYIMTGVTIYIFALFALAEGIKRLGRKLKFSRNTNRIVTFVLVFLLSWAMNMTITFSAMELREQGILDRGEKENAADAPLRMEDLLDVEEFYMMPLIDSESIFLRYRKTSVMPHFDEEHRSVLPNMEYTILDVKMPFLYETAKAQMVKDLTQAARLNTPYEYRDRLVSSDPSPWGAGEAYYVVNDYDAAESNHYFLCYADRLVDIEFSWTPTQAQMATVGEKVG
ncbi:MAG: DUF2812 domain-containing protein [Oscillospiraceae bacterium]|nr:DUF2812 domain-containing protein [Oscillospiraceae bacterium]